MRLTRRLGKTKRSGPVSFQQQAGLDVIAGLSSNKALQPTLRVGSTVPRDAADPRTEGGSLTRRKPLCYGQSSCIRPVSKGFPYGC